MTPDFSPRKAAYYTLGCKLNFAETSTIGKILSDRGFRRALPDEIPDLCIINTCSVTEIADKKGRSLIRRLSRRWPSSTLVVTGCYAQLKPEEVAAIEGVDIVLGSNEKLRILEYLDAWEKDHMPIVKSTSHKEITEFRPSCEHGDRTRYWLKVQDGCDYFCTYCTIPFARGRSRSGRIADLVDQANQVVASGGKEIVLTGVNIGEFGRDTGESFFRLLKSLDSVEGIERYRISSIEPNLLSEEIIRWIASEARAFMPHFHVPLQSGSDRVLKLMNRRYDTNMFASRILLIKELIPDAFIGIDVITGARGETDQEWLKSLEFIKSLPVSRLHVFPYSERPGTAALMMNAPSIDSAERHRRVGILQQVSDKKLQDFSESMLQTERKVLWEHPLHEKSAPVTLMSGLTDNYLRVVAPLDETLLNTVTTARLDAIDPYREETILASTQKH